MSLKWWNALWLQRALATYTATLCCADAAKKGTQGHLLDQYFAALEQDQKDSTHPVYQEVERSDIANECCDSISLGKGLAWINQAFFLVGRETMQAGLKSFFAEKRYYAADLPDFVRHINRAVQGQHSK